MRSSLNRTLGRQPRIARCPQPWRSQRGSPVARRQQPLARGSAWLMRRRPAPVRSRSIRDRTVVSRSQSCATRYGDSLEATTNSGQHHGHGGPGGSHRLRDGGDGLRQRQLRDWPRWHHRPRHGATDIAGWTVTGTDIDYLARILAGRRWHRSIDLNGFEAGRRSSRPSRRSSTPRTSSSSRCPATRARTAVPERRESPSIKTLTVHATGGSTDAYSFDTVAKGNTFTDMKWAHRPTPSRRRAPRPRCRSPAPRTVPSAPRSTTFVITETLATGAELQEGRLADHGRQGPGPRSGTRATASATTRPARRTSPSSR